MGLISINFSGCNDCKPIIKTEIQYVPKVIEKKIMVECQIDKPVCGKLSGKLDKKLFSSIECIIDLKEYIRACNGQNKK